MQLHAPSTTWHDAGSHADAHAEPAQVLLTFQCTVRQCIILRLLLVNHAKPQCGID